MSRRRKAVKRDIAPDMLYGSVTISRFINNVMEDGKKSIAENIVYKAFELIKSKNKIDPLEVFNNAIGNVKPYMEVRTVRVGGSNQQTPVPVTERRGYALAYRWLIKYAYLRKERSMIEKLAEELIEASHNRGGAVKRKEEMHKSAEANKAFAHFSPFASSSSSN